MNSYMKQYARYLVNCIYCFVVIFTIFTLFQQGKITGTVRIILILTLWLSMVFSCVISLHKKVPLILQGRIEMVMLLLISILFNYNMGWTRTLLGMLFFILVLISIYQIPRLNAELLIMSLILFIILYTFSGSTMLQSYKSIYEAHLEMLILLLAEIVMYFLQRQYSFESRKVYENEQSLDDLLKVVELKCDEAQQAIRVKDSFLANMSHEIRTPINAILGMNEVILRETKQDDIAEYAMDVQSAGRTLTAIINDILDYSKMESGKMELVLGEYYLSSVLNDVVSMISQKAKDKGLDLSLEVDERIPDHLFGDEIRFKQILLNLLNNAVKYTHDGSVHFSVSMDTLLDKMVMLHICITDTGIGIKKEEQDQLFKSFIRLDLEQNRNIEGTGLGLVITKQLVQMFQGEIYVESQYGKGSSFTVRIPQQVLEKTPIGAYQKQFEANKKRQRGGRDTFVAPEARILIVDDNIINLKVAAALLKETEIHVDMVTSGKACLEKVSQCDYDIILMDHMMPQMDGIETLEHIRELEIGERPHAIVIALTANAISGAREVYKNAGFDNYLSKPINTDKLNELLLQYLPQEYIKTKNTTVDITDVKLGIGLRSSEINQTKFLILDPPKQGTHASTRKLSDTNTSRLDGQQLDPEDKETLKELFESMGDQVISDMQKYVQSGDWRKYAILIHSIRKIAYILEYKNLYDLCLQEETIIRKQQQDYRFTNHDKILESCKVKLKQ